MYSTPFPEGAPDAVKLPGLATMQRFAKTLGYDFTDDELEKLARWFPAAALAQARGAGAQPPHTS